MSKSENIRKNLPGEYEKTPGYLLWDISEAVGQEMDLQDDEIRNTRELFDVDNVGKVHKAKKRDRKESGNTSSRTTTGTGLWDCSGRRPV